MSTTHDPLRLKTTQSQLNMTQTESTMTDYNLLDNSWTQTEKVEICMQYKNEMLDGRHMGLTPQYYRSPTHGQAETCGSNR